jgi:hypothetical protein
VRHAGRRRKGFCVQRSTAQRGYDAGSGCGLAAPMIFKFDLKIKRL